MPFLYSSDFNGIELLGARTSTRRCPKCMAPTHGYEDAAWDGVGPNVDFSASVDGLTVVSSAFVAHLKQWGVKDVHWRCLTNEMYLISPQEKIFLDLHGCDLKASQLCARCGRHGERLCELGPDYALLPGQQHVSSMSMLKTSQVFGSAHELFPFIVVGDELHGLIEESGMSGIFSSPLFQPDPIAVFFEERDT